MTNTKLRKRKATQFYILIFFIFPALTGMLSSCTAVSNEVDFTLTPMVENPATEELTLVPETEVATQVPTIITLTSESTKTNTLEPTATATEMPTPTEVAKEKYSIDLEKFYTMPPSYEDVVANPEKYQEAPDFLERPKSP